MSIRLHALGRQLDGLGDFGVADDDLLRRDSTEQELLRHVGTPNLGSSHCVRKK